MNLLKYEIFNDGIELTALKCERSYLLSVLFSESIDGFITIGGITVRIRDGEARVDLRLIDDGEHSPVLIQKSGRVTLPGIIKRGTSLAIAECRSEYIRGISMRERELAARVSELEAKLTELTSAVYGSTIF